MSSIALEVPAELAVEDAPLVLVVAGDGDARIRIVKALAAAELRVRSIASAREPLSEAPAPDLMVVHCEQIGSHERTLLRELKRRHRALPLVVVCQSAEARSSRRAVDGGADGVVFAEQVATALAPTVAAVLAGQTAVPTEVRANVHKPSLSFREKQILAMVVMGLTNSQIGARLYLAESTVKSHLSSAFTKLGVGSRSEAAALILDPREPLGAGIMATIGPLDRTRTAPAD